MMKFAGLICFAPLLFIAQVHGTSIGQRISKTEVLDAINNLIALCEDPYNYASSAIDNEEGMVYIYCEMKSSPTAAEAKVTDKLQTYINSFSFVSGHDSSKCLADEEENLRQLKKLATEGILKCSQHGVCQIGYEYFDVARNVIANNYRTIQELKKALAKCADDDEVCISNVSAVLPSLNDYPTKFDNIGNSIRFTGEFITKVMANCQAKAYDSFKQGANGILEKVHKCATLQ